MGTEGAISSLTADAAIGAAEALAVHAEVWRGEVVAARSIRCGQRACEERGAGAVVSTCMHAARSKRSVDSVPVKRERHSACNSGVGSAPGMSP